jgi:hypothetical protein
MFATRAYFSLSEITDPGKHRAHNQWHQLDHQPENLMLPGVALGSRWVRSPDCAAVSTGSAKPYMSSHYGIMYWFREPITETLDDFFALSERSFQWGRSPQVGWTRRPMRGFFAPLKGYVTPRVRVSVAALPYRPVKGVLITLSNLRGSEAERTEFLRWQDEVRFPDLLSCNGVAGAWTFAAEALFAPPWDEGRTSWSFADKTSRADNPQPQRLQILYLDEDPLEVLSNLQARDASLRKAGRLRDSTDVEDVLLMSPLRAIVAWQWDWFNRGSRS